MLVTLLVGVAALAGCGDGPTEPLRRGEFMAARARWRDTRPDAYQFTLTRNCFCLQEVVGPVVVEVVGDVVRSRRYEATGEPVPPLYEAFFPAVEGLFAAIEDAAARDPEVLDVEYDATNGYPARIYIDYRAQVADDEIGYVVRNFHAITAPP